jgi:hypothetical protein
METEKFIEVDKGPVIRFIADGAMTIASKLLQWFGPYATKYRYVWDGEDPFERLTVPYNQMSFGDIDE